MGKDDLDMLGGIYLHFLVIYTLLGYLEFYTINFPKTHVVECCVKIFWFIVARSIKTGWKLKYLAVSNPPLSGHQYLFCASPRQEKEYLQQTATNLPRKKALCLPMKLYLLTCLEETPVRSNLLHCICFDKSLHIFYLNSLKVSTDILGVWDQM